MSHSLIFFIICLTFNIKNVKLTQRYTWKNQLSLGAGKCNLKQNIINDGQNALLKYHFQNNILQFGVFL